MTTRAKFLSAALIAIAALATPAMARERHVVSRQIPADVNVNATPPATYMPYAKGRDCVPAPRAGQFASQPWDDTPSCGPSPLY